MRVPTNSRCPEIRSYHEGNGVRAGYMTMGNAIVPTRSDGWSVAKGAFYALDNQVDAHRIRTWLEDEPTMYDITMDDFHIKPVPIDEACSNLVLNPTFDGDLSFWSKSNQYRIDIFSLVVVDLIRISF